MGQYHIVVNLDKKEFLNPHKLGCGLKLWEQLANHPSTGTALIILLACSNGRGGGDLKVNEVSDGVIGRWSGDRVAIVGDYAEDGDLPKEFHAEGIYSACFDEEAGPNGGGQWKDITDMVCKVIEIELDGKFSSEEGWRDFTRNKPASKA